MSMKEVYAWFCRMKLRYSCCTLVCIFERHIVPELAKCGITHGQTFSDNLIELKALRCHSLFLGVPDTLHALDHPLLGRRQECIEIVSHNVLGAHLLHNVLSSTTTGFTVDIAIGQFMGSMQPIYCTSLGALGKHYAAGVIHREPNTNHDIREQLKRDEQLGYPKQITRLLMKELDQCRNCLCVPRSRHKLKRCSRCKQVWY